MKKRFYLFGMAAIMMASCTSDEFVGENNGNDFNQPKAIEFSYELPNMTRAASVTGATAADSLGKVFKVWGTKTIDNNETIVFGTLAYTQGTTNLTQNEPYHVWWDGVSNTSVSNTNGWEYVGKSYTVKDRNNADKTENTPVEQFIKYWDSAASLYTFVAFSNEGGAEIKVITDTDGNAVHQLDITDATAAKMAYTYLSDKVERRVTSPLTTQPAPVTFNFRSAAAKVRLGIYENIPGYSVKDVKFVADGTASEAAIATGRFLAEDSYKVTWETTDPCKAILTSTTITESNPDFPTEAGKIATELNFGNFPQGAIATTSAPPTYADKDDSNTSVYTWTPVLPTLASADMSFTVNFTLVANYTGETIEVTGAKVTIPAQYLKFKFNYAYTYILKITDKTIDGNLLYPITFDACVVQPLDAETGDTEQEGTITTFEPYSITTYQEGSVNGNNLCYKTTNGAIDIMVLNGSSNTVAISTNINNIDQDKYFAVYKVSDVITEGDAVEAIEKAIADDQNTYNLPTNWEKLTTNEMTVDETKATISSPQAGYYIVTYSAFNDVDKTNGPKVGELYYTKSTDTDASTVTYTKVTSSLSAFDSNTDYATKTVSCKVIEVK